MKRVRRPQGPKAISMNIYFYNSRNMNLGDNIAVYPKDLVILNVCEGSRAGTSHETFVRSLLFPYGPAT